MKPPYAIGSVPSLSGHASGHAIAYRFTGSRNCVPIYRVTQLRTDLSGHAIAYRWHYIFFVFAVVLVTLRSD